MRTILVADDSPALRELISGLLIENGFSVKTAVNGIEALEQAGQISPDLIILDVVMPEKNGFQVCRSLKQEPATQHIPVIICSTKDTQADHYWALKQGADAYIVKPFPENELIGTVKQLLRNSQK
ncbi:response regulator transcription factor [Aphanothece sacrum]|uniref:Two-component response regulator n=1 Tax=Aphanothece sacrum FPU1 TaxID=1920663 RepID=A0A401IF19_APHSA|nr:response regulator [Aphanothece sacrum]GBF79816.1 two-component response regulator [Aphanothece sacrum FPU1]GBF84828.1 two-component response regulator [Aphanothece sacrum FPU3]